MLLSRGTTILKSVCESNGRKRTAINLQQIRTRFAYRTAPVHETKWVVLSEIWAGMAWWWIFWNAWHDYEHITGHFPEIRPIDWSDEELGIPPD
ncbi:hypothetical protein QLX08_011445 [Tetragonisca angustula]|uniref:NADH dehydrogenase [ubiquinone] 1 beta subcomplex subunit 2, mitochondrial n=1 Tax=Tetragonisca angustula TaxID=166442 RepID=A0AAW0Z7X4_9HYME